MQQSVLIVYWLKNSEFSSFTINNLNCTFFAFCLVEILSFSLLSAYITVIFNSSLSCYFWLLSFRKFPSVTLTHSTITINSMQYSKLYALPLRVINIQVRQRIETFQRRHANHFIHVRVEPIRMSIFSMKISLLLIPKFEVSLFLSLVFCISYDLAPIPRNMQPDLVEAGF